MVEKSPCSTYMGFPIQIYGAIESNLILQLITNRPYSAVQMIQTERQY